MNEVDYLHQSWTESLLLEKKVELAALGVHQQEDVPNQTSDVQQMLVIKAEVPWSSILDQQDSEPLHIKEEEEEVWIREEEQHRGHNETEHSGILFSPVKSEDDEEKAQLFQLHQIKTEDIREAEPSTSSSAEQIKPEPDGGECGGPEPDRNHDPNAHFQSNTEEKALSSAVSDDDDKHGLDHFPHSGPESEIVLNVSIAPESEHDKDVPVEGTTQQESPKRAKRTQTAGKIFKGCDNPAIHIRSQKGEKPFDCELCRQKISLDCLQKYHLTIHPGRKPFKCGICGKTFKQKWLLRSHFIIHIEEKPFECEFCDRKFRHLSGMKSHRKTHTGDKPFKCKICCKTFSHQAGLKAHIRIHGAGKPFECEYCDEKFSDKTDLNDHMTNHKSKMPFCCSDCGKLFRLEFNFKRHLMDHGGEKSFDWDFFGENV